MKTTNRIRKNRSTAPAARLVKIPFIKFAPPAELTVTVVFFKAGVVFESDDDAIAAKVELPESIFNAIQQAAEQAGVSLSEYIMQACREKLSKDRAPQATTLASLQHRMDFRTLESSVDAANALLMVLGEKAQDSGLLALAENTILKLNADLTAASAAYKTPATESPKCEVAS